MGKNRGLLSRMFGMGGAAAPSEAEMAQMQDELARLDPKAIAQLPAELRDGLPAGGAKGLPGLGGGGVPRLPGLGGGGLPGLGGSLPKFPGFPGKKK